MILFSRFLGQFYSTEWSSVSSWRFSSALDSLLGFHSWTINYWCFFCKFREGVMLHKSCLIATEAVLQWSWFFYQPRFFLAAFLSNLLNFSFPSSLIFVWPQFFESSFLYEDNRLKMAMNCFCQSGDESWLLFLSLTSNNILWYCIFFI